MPAHYLVKAAASEVGTTVAFCQQPLALALALEVASQPAFPTLGLQIAFMASPASSTYTIALAVAGQHVYLWGHSPQSQFIPPMAHVMVGTPSLFVSS